MAQKLIVEFLRDWTHRKDLREKVLHKETTEMGAYGLDGTQIKLLRRFDRPMIAKQIAKELGIDMEDLHDAIYGEADPTSAIGAAAYDEGKTHIRLVVPSVISVNTLSEVVLMGQGFKSDPNLVTVEFRTGPPVNTITVAGNVTGIKCGVDVWQRVAVNVTLTATGDWEVRAHNDDDGNGPANWVWSAPTGKVHAVG
jgi:hypothetical protein